ncbi:nitrate regulatory gene2 protein [Quercus suber]|uniref:Nitrate regulatory gene2 protein n=1 Tax=Quercus suber TaxID=58331 RepID=A0AAW0J3V6_QUESU
MALKNTGAALSDFGHGEAEDPLHQNENDNEGLHNQPLESASNPPPPPPPPIEDSLLPPPPPLPNFSPSPSPIKRTTRTPPTPESKGAWDYFFMMENMPGSTLAEEDVGNIENVDVGVAQFGENVNVGPDIGVDIEPKTPEKVEEEEENKEEKQIEHAKTAPPEFRRVAAKGSSVRLKSILKELDDYFLQASESAQEVSKMLEATRLHYHSNFADNRGHINHSERVMRVITWNKSFRGMSNGEAGKDDFDSEEYETHATVLDKLLAWEKKLYEEVKQGELMKLEYQRKVNLLNKQKKRSVSAESLEKTKAAVSHLHTRYIVDMQSMDSTVLEVNRLRDEQLYPKLVALVDGMAKMWKNMSIHHENQLKLVTNLKSLDIAHEPRETSKQHYDHTVQLWDVVQQWHSQFEKLITHQKQYIQFLNNWLKLNLIPIESSLKEKVSIQPGVQHPPIQALLHSWHNYLEKLPDELVKSGISSFAAVIKSIILHQEEEMKLKEKCEETRKEFLRKNQAFVEWREKYLQRRGPEDMDTERGEDPNHKDPLTEKEFVVESLRKRLEEEVESHQRHCLQVREKSLVSLKTRLPELFRAMTDYAHACSETYVKLWAVTQSEKINGGAS